MSRLRRGEEYRDSDAPRSRRFGNSPDYQRELERGEAEKARAKGQRRRRHYRCRACGREKPAVSDLGAVLWRLKCQGCGRRGLVRLIEVSVRV